MFQEILQIIQAVSSMSPLAIIALLATVIWMQVKFQKQGDNIQRGQETIATNHLHDLPQIADDVRQMLEVLGRIERNQGENFAYIKARLNGSSSMPR